jgi:hypothetical protein
MADFHLARRTNDLKQFAACCTDINNLINSYQASGVKVYGLTLGDLTWDRFWYSNNFTLDHYIPERRLSGNCGMPPFIFQTIKKYS